MQVSNFKILRAAKYLRSPFHFLYPSHSPTPNFSQAGGRGGLKVSNFKILRAAKYLRSLFHFLYPSHSPTPNSSQAGGRGTASGQLKLTLLQQAIMQKGGDRRSSKSHLPWGHVWFRINATQIQFRMESLIRRITISKGHAKDYRLLLPLQRMTISVFPFALETDTKPHNCVHASLASPNSCCTLPTRATSLPFSKSAIPILIGMPACID